MKVTIISNLQPLLSVHNAFNIFCNKIPSIGKGSEKAGEDPLL